MAQKPYTLQPGEKATQVMIGTSDTLIWGDLVTKEQVQMSAFLNTLAEDFVPVHAAKILFLTPRQQMAPIERALLYLKQEEILLFFSMAGGETLPSESEVRRYEPVEIVIGSFQIEATILKSPIATMLNLLLVSKDAYMPFYRATIRHVANPWLGSLSSDVVQIRRDRLNLITL
ncbi:MAG: hypothetical protein JXA93_22775 [Anaerolineae bacterium]|nr:hypothetical protein [Anaerolineae bacterium]